MSFYSYNYVAVTGVDVTSCDDVMMSLCSRSTKEISGSILPLDSFSSRRRLPLLSPPTWLQEGIIGRRRLMKASAGSCHDLSMQTLRIVGVGE